MRVYWGHSGQLVHRLRVGDVQRSFVLEVVRVDVDRHWRLRKILPMAMRLYLEKKRTQSWRSVYTYSCRRCRR